MIRVMMICLGNICRSPMAEFVLKDMVAKRGLSDCFEIASAATSTEEIGNPVHPGTRRKLAEVGISTAGKYAVQVKRSDYDRYDYFLLADSSNLRNIRRIIPADPENKIHRLLDFSDRPRDIADPWYTGNFDVTYDDVVEGCEAFLRHVLNERKKNKWNSGICIKKTVLLQASSIFVVKKCPMVCTILWEAWLSAM